MYAQNYLGGSDFDNPSTTLGPKPNMSENSWILCLDILQNCRDTLHEDSSTRLSIQMKLV